MKYTHQERRIEMKLMDLFIRKGESSEASFGGNDKSGKAPFKDSKEPFISKEDSDEDKIYSKEFKELAITLAKKIGIEKAAEELKVPANSIRSWKKAFDIYALAQNTTSSQSNKELNDSIDEYELSPLAQNTISSQSSEEPNDSTNKYELGSLAQNTNAPIQDEYGVLRFSLDGKDYCFNVNSEKERRRVKEEINANSLVQYDWFDEETGEEHWVLYNTEMYEIKDFHLHYKEGSLLAPVIPINATSCYAMFRDCSHLPTLNFSDFDTSNVVDMDYMFARCSNFITLDLSGFNTSKVTEMRSMFEHCTALLYLDLSRFDTSKVTDMNSMFYRCSNATFIDVANFDTSNVIDMSNMFAYCKLLIKLNLCKFDTSNVASSENMFYYCESLETIYVSYKWNLNIYPCPRAGL